MDRNTDLAELQRRCAALSAELLGAGARVTIHVTEDPPAELLTRNRYRLGDVRRYPALDGTECTLWINGQKRAHLQLPTAQFNDLVADLGLRPTTPTAQEYESTPLGGTFPGRIPGGEPWKR